MREGKCELSDRNPRHDWSPAFNGDLEELRLERANMEAPLQSSAFA